MFTLRRPQCVPPAEVSHFLTMRQNGGAWKFAPKGHKAACFRPFRSVVPHTMSMATVQGLARSDSVTTGTSYETDINEKLKGVPVAKPPPHNLTAITEAEEDENVGYSVYKQGIAQNHEITAKENSAIRWRLDMIILPMFLVTQTLQFLDVRFFSLMVFP
jgi:hypothetical protein